MTWLRQPRIQRTIAWVAAVCAAGALLGVVRHEGQVRERQFCQLVIDRHVDSHKRIQDQAAFLDSPAGAAPENRGLATYVREISLPQLRQDLRIERKRLPPVCDPELHAAIAAGKLRR